MRSSRRRALALVALALLACVGAALVEESFVHTDDGCSVEIHCLACRLAVGTTAVMGAALAMPTVSQAATLVATDAGASPRDAAPRQSPSRAPPLS